MAFSTIGLEPQIKLVEENIKNEDDTLVVFIHWLLVKNGFLCIGLGENVDIPDIVERTELLPAGWSGGHTYAIRYLDLNSKLFILRGLKNDVNIIFNFVRTEDLNVTSVSFNSKKEVKALCGNVSSMYSNPAEIGSCIVNNMISPQLQANKETASTQTKTPEPERGVCSHSQLEPRRDPLMIGEPRMPPRLDPFNYGRSDLDPMANRGGMPGGGMLFDPFSQDRRGRIDPSSGIPGPGLPRGAVPPGARFDPFGPPDPERDFGLRGPGARQPRLPGSGPNPDILPPGYDDMFM